MLHTIIDGKLYDEQYIAGYTEGFEAAEGAHQGLLAGEDGGGLRHPGADPARCRAALRDDPAPR